MSRCESEPIDFPPLPSNNGLDYPRTHSQPTNSTPTQQNKFCHNSCYGAEGGLRFIINLNS